MTDSETPPFDPRAMWEERYGGDDYLYGTEPNEFLRDQVADLPVGDVLCLADGEGRNSVFLATLGHRVTAVDLTEAGIAKADRLAEQRNVDLTTIVADLADFDLGENRWDLIVSIFAHTPPAVRSRLHGAIVTALRPGGRFVLEAYTPDQIGRGTGGPPIPELTMTLDGLRQELSGLEIVHGIEIVRTIVEGPGHTGDGAVVQVVARNGAVASSGR
jgi:SAM-dependent methyltransferase